MVGTLRRNSAARAFTLIELIAVIVVLAILSGIAIPKYFDYANQAKKSACKGTLGAVRSAVAQFHANASLTPAGAAYPTLLNMQTVGAVLQEAIPANPFNNSAAIATATWDATNPPVAGTNGWNFDPSNGRFWANSAQNSDTDGPENRW